MVPTKQNYQDEGIQADLQKVFQIKLNCKSDLTQLSNAQEKLALKFVTYQLNLTKSNLK